MSWFEDMGYDAYDDEDFFQLLSFEYEVGYWETKDGKRIPIRKMELSHIQNCIAWLKRTKEKTVEQYGEHDDSILEIEAKIEEFEEEIEKRHDFKNKEAF